MKIIGVDTETAPILDGLLAPPLAVLSYCDGQYRALVPYTEAPAWFRDCLKRAMAGEFVIAGHNFAYDTAVLAAHDLSLLPDIFAAYSQGVILDTMMVEKLFDIGVGAALYAGHALDSLADKYCDMQLDKANPWRTRYATLRDTPLEQWPKEAVEYALDDATATRRVLEAQLALAAPGERYSGWLVNAAVQARNEFSIHLQCVWGMRTDPTRVAALRAALEKDQGELRDVLLEAGLLIPNKKKPGVFIKPQKAVRDLVTTAYQGNPPTTPKGGVSVDRKNLLATKDRRLEAYADYVANEKLRTTYLPVLEEGARHPINARFHIVETGRRAATKNMQTPPKAEGVRECYVPRPGFVLCSCDYDSLELRALAQINLDLFGSSPLADLYRDDPNADPHTKFAAENFLGVSYEEGMRLKKARDPELLRFRQAAKAYNFGLPGGLGAPRFVSFAKDQYGFDMTLEEARRGKAQWIKTWRMQPFFDYVNHRVNNFGWMELPRSRRVRGNIGYCDGANYLFQGPAADGACEAHFEVSRRCYLFGSSPLYGSRVVNFLHDELLLEIPEHRAPDAALELCTVMSEAMSVYLPDIPITTSPALMRFWSKKSEAVYDDAGVLQVWEPTS